MDRGDKITNQMSASYTKLKQGWGLRVTGAVPVAGQTVQVTTKAGAIKTETVAKVIWQGDDKYSPGQKVALCLIDQRARSSGGGGRDQGWRGNGCSACRARGDWCDRCAFDEFDN